MRLGAGWPIAAVTGKPITIYGDGKQVRDVLHVEDLLDAYDLAVEKIDRATGQVYNVGGGTGNVLAVWAEFGPLLDGNAVITGSYFTWSDSSPVPGVRTDAELAAGPEGQLRDPQTGAGIQRRWTVWDYVPIGGKATVTRLISVSIIYHEPGRPKPRELVFYGERDNPGPLLLEMVL